MNPESHVSEQYLLDYLREEFRAHPEIRVRRHRENHEDGILLQTTAREYFFPLLWAHRQDFAQIRKVVLEVRAAIHSPD